MVKKENSMAKQIADIGVKLVWALVVLLLSILMAISIQRAQAAYVIAVDSVTEIAKINVQAEADKERLKRIEDDTRYIKEKLVNHLIEGE